MRSGCMLHCGTLKKRGDEMPHRYLTDECSVQQRHAKTAIHNCTRPYCPLTGDLLVPIASQVMCSTFWVGSVLTVYKGFQGSNGTKQRARLLGDLGLVVLFLHQSATVCSHTSKHPLFFGNNVCKQSRCESTLHVIQHLQGLAGYCSVFLRNSTRRWWGKPKSISITTKPCRTGRTKRSNVTQEFKMSLC